MVRAASVRLGMITALAWLANGPAAAEVTITVNQDRVDLDARSAPLSEVLDHLARQTAMQVTYEGAPPRTLVTATVAAATQTEAVLAVLEGLGVNYAIQLDQTGSQVRTLLLIAARSGSAPPRPAANASPRMPQPPQMDEDDEPIDDEEDEPPIDIRPERPADRRLRPGRERPGNPGLFHPTVPADAGSVQGPGPVPVPVPAYPVSPFAPVAPPPAAVAPPPPPAPPDPDSEGL